MNLFVDNENYDIVVFNKLKEKPTEVLHDLIFETDEVVSETAMMFLHTRGEKATYQKAVELCTSSHDEHRDLGAVLLGQLGTPEMPYAKESAPLLIDLVENDSSDEVRESAIYGIGHLQLAKGVTAVGKFVCSPNKRIRKAIAFAFGRTGGFEAVQSLVQLCKDKDEDVRNWAAFGLRMLNSEEVKYDSSEMRNVLVSLLNDSNSEIREEAICALALLKDGHVFEHIEAGLNSEDISFQIIEAAGDLGDIRFLPRLRELHVEWGDTSPSELIDALAKLTHEYEKEEVGDIL